MDDEMNLADRLEAMTVRVKSPDGTVRATCGITDGLQVSISESGMRDHSERSLADQLKAVISSARSGFIGATGKLADDSGITPEMTGTLAVDAKTFVSEMDEVDVWEVSPRGLIEVGLRGGGEVGVHIAEGSLRRHGVTHAQLESEVNAAIAAASSAYGRGRAKVAERLLGVDE